MINTDKFAIVVLISGNGSNLQAIIDAIKTKNLPVEIRAVISNQPHAFGLERAAKAQIPTVSLPATPEMTKISYDKNLMQVIDEFKPDLVVLAGFMRILSSEFVRHYWGKLINIHPSLLPKYPGLSTHTRVLAAGEKEHGASIHFVTEEVDGGSIIAQASLLVSSNDDADSLKTRVHALEHQLYPLVISWFAAGRIFLRPEGVFLDNQLLTSNRIILSESYPH